MKLSIHPVAAQDVPEGIPSLNVLVALDGSPAAATALPVSRILASQLGAQVTALHVAPVALDPAEARRRLNLDTEDTRDIRIILRVGDPVAEIVRAANDKSVTLLAMAACAAHSVRPLASVTLSVLRDADRPVVLVRPELVLGNESALRPVHRLLLPVDGSPTTARALRSAAELAQGLGASIDLLYVAGSERGEAERGSISVPRYVDQPHHEWPLWSEEVIDRLTRCLARCPEEVPVELFLAIGDPRAEIVRFAAEHQEDALVLVRRSQLEPGRGKILWHLFEKSPLSMIFVVSPYRR